ncbi:MAG: conserved membrane protein of unknown function [Promethearchaeota archaeon]|nr:MAG: conserved membrane protein of unknown function [Candidatus Lokiarchaeota archaeon]
MGLEDLETLEIIHGTFTLTFVLISILIGIRILLKYFKLKRKEIITVGLSWLFLSSAWWGSSFSFLSILLLDIPFNEFIYFSLGNLFIPIAVISWIYSINKMLYNGEKNWLVMVFLAISLIYEIILIIFLFQEPLYPTYIGTIVESFYYKPGLITMAYQLFAILVTIFTGVLFSLKSIKSEEDLVKWKGRFLLLAFLAFSVGAIFDALIELNEVTIIIIRLILILSSIGYYLGFFLPDKLAHILGVK